MSTYEYSSDGIAMPDPVIWVPPEDFDPTEDIYGELDTPEDDIEWDVAPRLEETGQFPWYGDWDTEPPF